MNVLFVCTGNVFRSVIAEELFKKLNKNKSINVKSAGVSADGHGKHHLDKYFKKLGIEKLVKKKSTQITPELIDWADLVVCMERSHEAYVKLIHPEKKTLVFRIEDDFTHGEIHTADVIKRLSKKVEDLVKKLS